MTVTDATAQLAHAVRPPGPRGPLLRGGHSGRPEPRRAPHDNDTHHPEDHRRSE